MHHAIAPNLTVQQVRTALSQVRDPLREGDIVATGRVSGVVVREGQVGFLIGISPDEHETMQLVREKAEDAVAALAGVSKVTAVLTAEASPAAPLNAHQEAALAKGRSAATVRATWNTAPLAGVARVVAVSSGKGGVGKSTLTVLLAQALCAQGMRVGVLDADIYGPSMARMLGLRGKPEAENGLVCPGAGSLGIPALSMGQLVAENEALVWRGPQLTKTLQQLTRGADWQRCYDGQGLQLLLIDMPPGTGDVQLSLAQQLPLDGALVATIPSMVSVMDAAKCITMWRKVQVPVLGVVENMSGLLLPDGALQPVFGTGGGQRLAQEQAVPLLAQLPLWPGLNVAMDAGSPAMAAAIAAMAPIIAAIG